MSPSAILPIGTASWAMSARKAWPVRTARRVDVAVSRAGCGREVPDDDDVVGRVRNAVGADADDQLREARWRPGMKLP